MSTIKRSIVISIGCLISLVIFILSPYALYPIATILELQLPISIHGLSGSLWTGHIQIEKLEVHDSNDPIILQNISATNISLSSFSADHITIKSAYINHLFDLNAQPETSAPNFTFKKLTIDHLKMPSLPGLNDIDISHIHLDIDHPKQSLSLSAELLEEHYLFTISARPDHTSYNIQASNSFGQIALTALKTDNQLVFSSTPQSDIDAISASYFFSDRSIAVDIEHQSDMDINFKLGYNPSNQQLVADITKLNIPIGHHNLEVSGNIDSSIGSYTLNGQYNHSHLKVRTMKNKGVAISSSIADLSSLSPIIQGSCELNAYYHGGQWSLYSYSENLALPFAKLTDVQLSYNSQGKQQVYLTASQLRNSALKIEQPSLKVATIEEGFILNVFGLSDQLPQTLQATMTSQGNAFQILINQFTARSHDGSLWSIDQPLPIIIDTDGISSGPISFTSSKNQSLFINGKYNFHSADWWVENKVKNFEFSVNSQGLIDSDTDIVIHSVNVNGNGKIAKTANQPISFNGFYQLSNLNASLLNIVPNFSFPLDYHVEGSAITWADGNLSGHLRSAQGDIKLIAGDQKTFIESPNLVFANHNNRISAEILFIHELDRLLGQVYLHDISLNFDPEDSFVSFPKDIKVIGDMPTAKTQASPIQYNIEIHANEIPAELLGFKGILTTDLKLFVPEEGKEKVTGNVQMADPKLALLNKLISLKELSINYNDQAWTEGMLNVQLQQKTTLHTSRTDTTNAEINLSVAGRLESPSVEISTNPIHLSKDQSLTQILLSSPSLPTGNENSRLLEIISGMNRNEGVIAILHTMNNLRPLSLDISFRRSLETPSSMPLIGSLDLLISKQIYDKMWISYEKPLHDDNYTVTLDFQVKPWLSAVAQYNSDAFFSFNLFYSQ
ncbi:MAG: translocation/assembly module TamB domain-containing protein [Pseudomonadota bacterium]|nr:translocation/assembly module TamB domain-containing protein [Pseudomonadota bacterium]